VTQRDLRDYLQDILDTIDIAQQFVAGMTFADFQADQKTVFAVIRAIEVIGEAVKKLPNELRCKYTSIEWRAMAGMRDRLIHNYFGVDYDIVWDVVVNKLPALEREIRLILEQEYLDIS